VPREIELFIPLPELRAIAVEQLELVGGQFEAVVGERGGESGWRVGGQREGAFLGWWNFWIVAVSWNESRRASSTAKFVFG